jgi:hypothetical protein
MILFEVKDKGTPFEQSEGLWRHGINLRYQSDITAFHSQVQKQA